MDANKLKQTPVNIASYKGHLEVVRPFCCRALGCTSPRRTSGVARRRLLLANRATRDHRTIASLSVPPPESAPFLFL